LNRIGEEELPMFEQRRLVRHSAAIFGARSPALTRSLVDPIADLSLIGVLAEGGSKH